MRSRADDPALVLAIEGCDFLEADLDRLDAMEARGVREHPAHAHPGERDRRYPDRAAGKSGGLTKFGAGVVRRMNETGVICDVAHCSGDTVRGVVTATSKPILCTHANLLEPGVPGGEHPRFISLDYAKMVAATGGVIGAWLSTLTVEKVPGMIRHMFRAIDAVGIDHVGIAHRFAGRSVARTEMPNFVRHPELAQAMRRDQAHDRGRGGASLFRQLAARVPCGARLMARDDQKQAAAAAAVALVEDGMLVGRLAPVPPRLMRSGCWGNATAPDSGSPVFRVRSRARTWLDRMALN